MYAEKFACASLSYEELIAALVQKDPKGLAGLAVPHIHQAKRVLPNPVQYSFLDIKAPDYLSKISIDRKTYLLHMEFEAAYTSNRKMERRMLKYYSGLQHLQLPIRQMVVLLKKPPVTAISTGVQANVPEAEPLRFSYEVLPLYQMNKYESLVPKRKALYPLRIFMAHPGESPQEHLRECLALAKTIRDTDYYFLTVEYARKIYQNKTIAKFLDEKIYTASSLHRRYTESHA